MSNIRPGRRFSIHIEKGDSLLPLREAFIVPRNDEGEVYTYLCGHSLGLQPVNAKEEVAAILRQWGDKGVKGHFEGDSWIHYQDEIDEWMSKLVGAKLSEVCVMNTLTINLHLMLTSFYNPAPGRTKILIEEKAFPSDQYAIKSQLRLNGHNDDSIVIWPINAETGFYEWDDFKTIMTQQGNQIALILLGGVQYFNGQRFSLSKITTLAHQYGTIVGFDLAHAVGNVPLQLHSWEVDFAVWCTYKYLNGGPGSSGACFIHEKHHGRALNRLEGWWGNDTSNRFEMLDDFTPAGGARSWMLSNPSILALAPLKTSLKIFDQIGMSKLSQKAEWLSSYLYDRLENLDTDKFRILTPSDYSHRGTMLSIQFAHQGRKIFKALTNANIVVDWRNPDVIRVAPVPLYNDYEECYRFAKILGEALS